MKRRNVLGLLTAAAASGLLWRYWPEDGLFNPCRTDVLPAELAQHDLMHKVWDGIDPHRVWDCHLHLLGLGDNNSDIWINPNMDSILSPKQYLQKRFYLNASCVPTKGDGDISFISYLNYMLSAFPMAYKAMLLAFDYHYDEQGNKQLAHSPFYVPNDYAAKIANQYPDRLEWIASIHPYRADCVEALEKAVRHGAKAIKWLPPAMGMDPASPLCDRFYAAMVRYNIPLLSHGGYEQAVHSPRMQAMGNPLRLRRALAHGVRVIVSHCAYLGKGVDLDEGEKGPLVDNFSLFARLMDEKQYRDKLYGEIAAMGQILRMGEPLKIILERNDWHDRLLYGSDYPLPGVMPIYSLKSLSRKGYIKREEISFLSQLRQHNPLLFDFALKRLLNVNGKRFSAGLFHTRHVFN